MVVINSDDYHDFVIKEGKLIGEFEQMYQKSREVPWHQDKQDNWLDIRFTIELLKDHCKYFKISDFGCGLGYFLNKISQVVASDDCILYGYDISETACKKGSVLFPKINFKKLDLMAENVFSFEREKGEKERRREGEKERRSLLLLRGTLWYVFPKINNVVKNIALYAEYGDHLLISQNFPPLSSNFVGKEIIPNPQAIIKLFSDFFSPVKSAWIEDYLSQGNCNWFIILMERI